MRCSIILLKVLDGWINNVSLYRIRIVKIDKHDYGIDCTDSLTMALTVGVRVLYVVLFLLDKSLLRNFCTMYS